MKFTTMYGPSIFAVTLISSCASAPTQQTINSADYGTPITQDEAVSAVTSYEKSRAKDPESLRINCGSVSKNWTANRLSKSSFVAGYLIDCSINGKNSFGGYVGARNYRFLIHDGSIVRVLEQMGNGGYGPEGMVDALRNMN